MDGNPKLPVFKYHPDPIRTGSVVPSLSPCACCGASRGYLYDGPVYGGEDAKVQICPWCIAAGSAAERLGVEFTDSKGIGDYGRWPPVSDAVIAEVARRTPGFTGWQFERWRTCCDDACEYLGRAGEKELSGAWAEARASVLEDAGVAAEDSTSFLRSLNADGDATAYVFRCRSCGKLSGYFDAN